MSEIINTSDNIYIPYNENTKYIYEGFAKVAREIAERKQEAENISVRDIKQNKNFYN